MIERKVKVFGVLGKVLGIVGLLSLLGGCSIAPLSHEGLAEHHAVRSGSIAVAERAEGLNGNKVGWGRITPFAIPVVPIYVKGDEAVDLMANIKEALALAGYSPNSLEPAVQGVRGLSLQASVTKKRYSNYTYFAPLVPTWGGIKVTLSLVNPVGEAVWMQNFSGGGFTFNFFDGYNIASRESMTEMLDEMVLAFSSEEFFHALQSESALDGVLASEETSVGSR